MTAPLGQGHDLQYYGPHGWTLLDSFGMKGRALQLGIEAASDPEGFPQWRVVSPEAEVLYRMTRLDNGVLVQKGE